jgi:trimeric autotransporter adhesin
MRTIRHTCERPIWCGRLSLSAVLCVCPGVMAQPTCDQWQALGAGMGGNAAAVLALAVYEGGGGSQLHAGGTFVQAGGQEARRVAHWDGAQWHALGSGIGEPHHAGGVSTLAIHNGRLVVGGGFTVAGGAPANNVAAWDGWQWQTMGDGMNWVEWIALSVYRGEVVAAGGLFAHGHIARFDGGSWLTLGGGFWQPPNSSFPSIVGPVAVLGNDLYVGGTLLALTGREDRHNLVRWDGTAWHVGFWTGGFITALQVHGGELVAAEQVTGPAARVWRWDGAAWQSVGSGMGGGAIRAFGEYFGELVAGGAFTSADGQPASRIARWNGQQWRPMGDGMNATVRAIMAHDAVLFIGGDFTQAGGLPAVGIAAWRDCARCYANCDGSTIEPVLNVEDFTCFINEFAIGQSLPPAQQVGHYANCDASTTPPVLNVEDFTCFINAFAAGCQ